MAIYACLQNFRYLRYHHYLGHRSLHIASGIIILTFIKSLYWPSYKIHMVCLPVQLLKLLEDKVDEKFKCTHQNVTYVTILFSEGAQAIIEFPSNFIWLYYAWLISNSKSRIKVLKAVIYCKMYQNVTYVTVTYVTIFLKKILLPNKSELCVVFEFILWDYMYK